MKLLALDTATDLCSAALWVDGRVDSREELAPRAHGRLLLPMVHSLLAAACLGLHQLDAIAFGRGPGAFTGLRLAAAVAQGLGFAAVLPLIPVSDLRALAAQALARAPVRLSRALICQDARMSEVYWGCFERRDESVRLIDNERVGDPETIALPHTWQSAAPRAPTQPAPAQPVLERGADSGATICGAGSGFTAYPLLQARFGSRLGVLLPDLYPRAREIAELAVQDGLSCAVSPEQALPVYLRDQVASVAEPSRN